MNGYEVLTGMYFGIFATRNVKEMRGERCMKVPKCIGCEHHRRIKNTKGSYSHNCGKLNLKYMPSQITVHGSPKWCPLRKGNVYADKI